MLVQTLQRRHGRGRFEVCRGRFGFGELQQASWQLALLSHSTLERGMLVQTLQRRHGRGRFEVCRARFGFGELQQASWQLALLSRSTLRRGMLVQTLQRRHGRGRFEVCRARFGFGELQQASWQLALHLLVPRSGVECRSRRSSADTFVLGSRCVGGGFVLGSVMSKLTACSTLGSPPVRQSSLLMLARGTCLRGYGRLGWWCP